MVLHEQTKTRGGAERAEAEAHGGLGVFRCSGALGASWRQVVQVRGGLWDAVCGRIPLGLG
jgi:hypothetical protein